RWSHVCLVSWHRASRSHKAYLGIEGPQPPDQTPIGVRETDLAGQEHPVERQRANKAIIRLYGSKSQTLEQTFAFECCFQSCRGGIHASPNSSMILPAWCGAAGRRIGTCTPASLYRWTALITVAGSPDAVMPSI